MSAMEKSDLPEVAGSERTRRPRPPRSPWSEGAGPRRMRTCKARSGRRAGKPCHERRPAYEKPSSGTEQDKLTALLHHINVDVLRAGFFGLKKTAAPGVDEMTWTEYAEHLEAKPRDLHARVHTGAYRALPSRRKYIPKADGRQRPLGIAAIEDKIVQAAVVAILTPIYESEFLGFSYGFRPKRNQHQALDALAFGIGRRRINWVLDCDVQSFFDKISQDWLIRFVEHRIGDRRIIRLIAKWLTAGVLEDGRVIETEEGTPQGAVMAP